MAQATVKIGVDGADALARLSEAYAARLSALPEPLREVLINQFLGLVESSLLKLAPSGPASAPMTGDLRVRLDFRGLEEVVAATGRALDEVVGLHDGASPVVVDDSGDSEASPGDAT